MQAFSEDARVPKSWLIVAAMLDLQKRLIPSPLVALSTLPNLPLLLKSKMAAIAFARPKNTPALQAKVSSKRESLKRVLSFSSFGDSRGTCGGLVICKKLFCNQKNRSKPARVGRLLTQKKRNLYQFSLSKT